MTRGGPTDPSHDDDLRRGILRTDVARPVALLLVAPFLLAIAAVPVSQTIMEKVRGDESVIPDLWKGVPTRESLKQLEDDLGNASYPREAVRPYVQWALARFGRFGNTKAVLGREAGWLFYYPGIAAVGGPGLLDTDLLASRKKAAADDGDAALYPDPRPAILDMRRFLASRGVALVLFPAPDKAGLQPRELHGRFPAPGATAAPGENADYRRLVSELEQAGVAVFDPTPPVLHGGEAPRFMQQDTHWTPEWMEEVAARLGAFLTAERHLLPPAARPRAWRAAPATVSRVGDIVDMLKLPQEQTLFAPQTATIHPVTDEAGVPFAPEARADVLLLGDSYANIYSLGQMGWGENAGLGPQLARALGRDVDVIAQNDAGAHATRQLLANALQEKDSAGQDRLAGKKVVVWEFASRELAVGNWKPVAWEPAAPGAAAR